MGNSRLMSGILILSKIVHVAIALALTTLSIWLFVDIISVSNIRNKSQVNTEYEIYWPVALPWVFILSALLCLFVSGCGFVGAGARIKGLVRVYMTFEVVSILTLVLAAALALVYGTDPQNTDKYVNDVFTSAFHNVKMSYEHDPSVSEAFGRVESYLHCCGSVGPEDYKSPMPIPESCCDKVYPGCNNLNNPLIAQKTGCATVAAVYTRFCFKTLAYISIVAAVLGVANVVLALLLNRSLSKKSRDVPQDPETKKVLI